jgi:hypothetical protein
MRRGWVLAWCALAAALLVAAACVLVIGRGDPGADGSLVVAPPTSSVPDPDVERVERLSESIKDSLDAGVPAAGSLEDLSEEVVRTVGVRGRVQSVSTSDDAVSVLVVVAPTGASRAMKVPDAREPATACFLFTRAARAATFVRTRLPGCEMAVAL